MVNPILVALDVATAGEALALARRVRSHVGGFKVGLELLMGEGPVVVGRVNELGLPVFVDAKLHDIPNTVAGAARQLGSHGARWVTVHSSGGTEMVAAAVEALDSGSGGQAGVLAVTVLTSVDESVLSEIGVGRDVEAQVTELARSASKAGAEGVICSVAEVGIAKAAAPRLLAVTPGIRLAGASHDDQRRVSTPRQAIAAGADYLVVGRAITRADDPAAAARMVAAEVGIDSP